MLKINENGQVYDESTGELIKCQYCRNILEEKDVTGIDSDGTLHFDKDSFGHLYCESCAEDLVTCHDCGDVLHRRLHNIGYLDCVDDWVCDSCLCNNYSYCDNCGEYRPNDEVQEVYVHNRGYRNICEGCLGDDYVQCNNCGDWVLTEDAYQDDWGDWYCRDCCPSNGSGIQDYHYTDDPAYDMPYLGEENRYGKLLMGWELEVEKNGGWRHSDRPNEIANNVREKLGQDYCVICHDGSLDDGFEIISCPANLDHHLKTLKIKETLQYLNDNGFISHSSGNCGLHVHMDRVFFGGLSKEDVEGRFFIILRNNLEWIKLFSRRFHYGYCKINGYDNNFSGEGDSLGKISYPPDKVWLNSKKQNERHMALNFYPSDTIEIRIFRGTLKYETFIATLQFCDVYAEIVKRYDNRQVLDVNLTTFRDYAQRKGYTEFEEYLKRRHIIDDTSQEL